MKRPIDAENDFPEAREPLNRLAKELLRTHKMLLDMTREDYERQHGRIESSYKFLDLVINDPYFAWLRKISELIVVIDEIVDREITLADVEATAREVESLLFSPDAMPEFNGRFRDLLERDVNVLMQQNVVRAAIAALPRKQAPPEG